MLINNRGGTFRSIAHATSGHQKIALVGLSSPWYPALGESHGIYVLAGDLKHHFGEAIDLKILDMCANFILSSREIVRKLLFWQPDIIGFSVLQGTCGNLETILNKIIQKKGNEPPLIVLGNCVPTYAYKELLQRYPFAIIALGEGELSLRGLVEYSTHNRKLSDVPNIIFLDKEETIRTQRMLVNLNSVGMPMRVSPGSLAKKGVQIFVEGSRGCHWGRCTFCSRKLLGLCRNDWRPFAISKIISQIESLSRQGVWEITFSDEDFIGPLSIGLKRAKGMAEEIIRRNILTSFRISCLVESVFALGDDHEVAKIKKETFEMLKKAGLKKVFLGVESGANTQLERYQKGFSVGEASKAVDFVRELGIELEVGFVMFDPLMSLDELDENMSFVENKRILPNLSEVLREMRAQPGSSMVKILKAQGKKRGLSFIGEELDLDTLTYPVKYQSIAISNIVTISRIWTETIHPLKYTLKADTRFGRSLDNTRRKAYLEGYLEKLKNLDLLLIKELKKTINEQRFSADNLLMELTKLEQTRSEITQELLFGILQDNSLDSSRRIEKKAKEFLSRVEPKRIYLHPLKSMFH